MGSGHFEAVCPAIVPSVFVVHSWFPFFGAGVTEILIGGIMATPIVFKVACHAACPAMCQSVGNDNWVIFNQNSHFNNLFDIFRADIYFGSGLTNRLQIGQLEFPSQKKGAGSFPIHFVIFSEIFFKGLMTLDT